MSPHHAQNPIQQQDIKRMQQKFYESGNLSHLDLISRIQRESKKIPMILPKADLQTALNYYRVVPLLEELALYKQIVIHGALSTEQNERLSELESKYQKLTKQKPTQQVMATDLESTKINAVRFDPFINNKLDLNYLLLQNGACFVDVRRIDSIVDDFYNDSLLGGSFIVSLETKSRISQEIKRKAKEKLKEDDSIKAVAKYFVVVDKNNNPALAVDHFSTGDYHARELADWSAIDKIDLFAYGPAIQLYLAEKLGISRLIFCDLEMNEFARTCGVPRKHVFETGNWKRGSYDKRKAGIIAVADNSRGVWHHKHSIYSVKDGRFPTLDYVPLTEQGIQFEFRTLYNSLIHDSLFEKSYVSGAELAKRRIPDQFTVLYTVLRIMEDAFINSRHFEECKTDYNRAINMIKKKSYGFAKDYVK